MPNLPISRLVSGTQSSDGDKFVYVQQGITKQVDYGDLQTSMMTDVDYIDFNTGSVVTGKPGRLRWNDKDGTLDLTLKGGNVTLQVGQESVIPAYNNTTSSLLQSEYRAVYISGSVNNFPAISIATNLDRRASENAIGIVTEDIAAGEVGYVTTYGLVRDMNLSSFVAGDTLYLGASDGVLINTPPPPPALTTIVGYVIDDDAVTGSLFVNVKSGYDYPAYISLLNTSTHTASLANTATVIDFDTTGLQSGITLENLTSIKVTYPGLYQLDFSAQLNRAANSGTDKMYFWLKKNGTDIPFSTSNVSMVGNVNTVAKTFNKISVLELLANDTVEYYWATTTVDLVLESSPTGSTPQRPSSPAATLLVTRLS